ncbi:hypothetical protein HPP92_022625 [Vanilla planifolia]|uniref:DUF4408 domain-containing protein n=1 Tax=Vanilla planifolia TaxID=51239 RepID=A0A835PXU1_VANPL|nr:hypothetical protein HPP92_022625 [Vanilla planifolia]
MDPWTSISILVRSWLTPTALFVLLNLVVGVIALISKSHLVHRHHGNAAEGHAIGRTASFGFNRLRSLSLSRLRSGDLFSDLVPLAVASTSAETAQPSSDPKIDEKVPERRLDRGHSENRPDEAERVAQGRIKKSASERSTESRELKRKALGKAEVVVENCVDARADDFINRFRRQLQLQRLNSLLRYKDMIGRGA